MFYLCGLKEIDISNLDTSFCIDMSYMFSDIHLTTLDVSNLNTSNVTNMGCMFRNLWDLTTLEISNFDTISKWVHF